jgi:hypothetical protein
MSDWTWNNKSKLQNMNSHYIPCRFRRNVKFRDQSGGIPGLQPDSGRNTRGRVKTSTCPNMHMTSCDISHHIICHVTYHICLSPGTGPV